MFSPNLCVKHLIAEAKGSFHWDLESIEGLGPPANGSMTFKHPEARKLMNKKIKCADC